MSKRNPPTPQKIPKDKRGKSRATDLIPIPGKRPVEELLRQEIEPVVLFSSKLPKGRKDDTLISKCRHAGWKVVFKEKSYLDSESGGLNHQGYLAFITYFPYVPLKSFIDQKSDKEPLLIALDQIQDAGNLGAILRSAECAGAKGAIIPAHRSAGITSAVIRRSAGAALCLPVSRVVNLAKTLDRLSDADFSIVGADQEGNRTIYDFEFKGPTVLVIGSEEKGLRPGIKRRCVQICSIPLYGRISSLNASAAAAVCLFEVARQRSASTR
ncbi:23S rRNA (guanosine(2251)-2'-O)-methyltransferase RlmB [candidate division LCP-89 bacterium B3_LCP]|uniref:23S rRNA (Guanosine(2251)-2'-O)-methyltransferase RlmB n=1 Tax=candidate division LCP-89 bacterium B3_LCP TaxID=2012998 RepID=A0A532V5V5_UNCL8|nr:MAG: 23S rRNA (guanosine(2251)-2'-O)-methyltransferase RlmB [candidate division LCP-89 bacterium B3_LCP]